VTRVPRSARRAAGMALAIRGLLASAAVLGVASCSGGAIADNTPVSNGQSFVGASYSSSYYAPGSRPAAPRVSGTTLTGAKLSLAALRGNVVVLNFWGSWCVPCREEAPILAAVAEKYQPSGVSFLGVDVRDTTASALAFAHSFHVAYPSVSDQSSAITLDFTAKVPIAGTPTTLVVDRTGHIAGAVFGTVTYPGLTAIVAKVTAEGG
jgi:thiol-disulfide isomerase/thioredoxin